MADRDAALSRSAIEALPCGVCHVAADGSIVVANAEAQRLLGLDDRGTFDLDMIKEDGSPCPLAEHPVTAALVTGRPQPSTTIGVRRRDGQFAWVSFRAVPVRDPEAGDVRGAIVTCVEITECKRREERLRAILDSAPNAIALADRNGNLIEQSRTPADIPKEGLMGRPVWTGLVPEDHPKAREAVFRVIATGEPASYEARGASGRRWLVRLGPWREAGRIEGVAFVAQDVTEQRELEARLAIADRMASIGTLAAGVAHEINNPLTYLLVNLQWLARRLDPADAVAHTALRAALEGAERIRSITADVSSFSHVDVGRSVLLDVRQLVDSALRMAHGEIRSRARVLTRYTETPPVFAGEGRLGQVFLNIVVNAAQAIPEGDVDANEIVVATRVDERGRVEVEISDTGIGIAPELIDKVFDPFVTTKPRGAGTGLGLYICRSVVTSLGGELTVTSAPGRGTTFRVSLPAAKHAARAEPSPPREPAAERGYARRRLAIAVADDESAILSLMQRLLVEHDVAVARSGREAIALLGARDFDLVFCDVVMPDLTGLDVYEYLRTTHAGREEKLVFVTAGALTERTRHFLKTVPNDILEKPFTLEDVMRLVAKRAAVDG